MPTTTVTIYRVNNSYFTDGSNPTITQVSSLTITDNDKRLHADEASDPGASQDMTINGNAVTSYQFYYDDTISINGTTVTVKTFQVVVGGTTRTYLMNSSGNNIPGVTDGTTFNLIGYTNYTNVQYSDLLCFVQSTRIQTAHGPKPIDDIRVGDLVKTKDHGMQPVRWIGKTDLSIRDMLARPHLRPILVPSNSLGRNLPQRDLYISPQHRILLRGWQVELNFGIDEVLASAKSLVGKYGIRIDAERRQVAYYHLMFDRHEVIFSEGLATESFLVGETIQDGMDQAQLDEILELFPELAASAGAKQVKPVRPILRRFEVNTLEEFAA